MKSESKNNFSYLSLGNEALRNGEYANAIALFRDALNQTPALSKIIEFNIEYAHRKFEQDQNIDKLPRISPTVQEIADGNPLNLYKLNNNNICIDVVVPVYNALQDVQRCLFAIENKTDGFDINIYVVNDASEIETSEWLREFCSSRPQFSLIENYENKGYTKTVNIGLRKCKGDYIVTLNSDTIVTDGWISYMVRCMKSDITIGVVGPLSNAASWQNVPNLLDENNQFAVNELPTDWEPDDMALVVRAASKCHYPKVPFVNGFCFMISRQAFEIVGLLDEETFPTGYGEENDYCIRVAQSGFSLAICDDAYVYHAKSKSFGHEKRKELSKKGSESLKAKHGKENIDRLASKIREMQIFAEIRESVRKQMTLSLIRKRKTIFLKRILFLLPVSGGGGGVHSIVQETLGMRRIGVQAKIAVPEKHLSKFIQKYSDIDCVEELFLGFNVDNLLEISNSFDVMIGTIFTSIKMLKEIVDANPTIQPAYYIQDYEPLFSDPGTSLWEEARNSYTLIPNAILFAKTDWICKKVFEEHGIFVRKVSPSIDHDVYKPDPLAKQRNGLEGKVVLSAMIRPKTPRRGAERTMRLLKQVHSKLGDSVHIELFGCGEEDPLFKKLDRDFNYINHGELSRSGVASVLQKSDCFLDLSDYQAFGRTGLEAMACGAFVLITKYGGVYEYALHLENSLIVDPFCDIDVDTLIEVLSDKIRVSRMKNSALMTASNFSIHKAALSELLIFS